jgi:hypothetical protein
MASKSFKTVPTPQRQPTNEQIDAFVNKAAPAPPPKEPIETARLSLDIPAELHTRFKVACARSRLKMTSELLALIERRTAELEGKQESDNAGM